MNQLNSFREGDTNSRNRREDLADLNLHQLNEEFIRVERRFESFRRRFLENTRVPPWEYETNSRPPWIPEPDFLQDMAEAEQRRDCLLQEIYRRDLWAIVRGRSQLDTRRADTTHEYGALVDQPLTPPVVRQELSNTGPVPERLAHYQWQDSDDEDGPRPKIGSHVEELD
ncbi:MAG: hypothetical protein MMC33_006606 [Icmadophila ericetorum]|nr:hypothetical protein [Icmadophila ericetorum]